MSNHGSVKQGNIRVDFGRDNSNVSGPPEKERGQTMAGSPTNLDHSLSGCKANQKGS